jgi:hypothetical protein
MAWKWDQKKGQLLNDSGVWVANGYSGYKDGKNNPQMQDVHDVGPIPKGVWQIEAMVVDGGHMGPHVLPLRPMPGTETFGREGFFIHGDSIHDPGDASRGCVILPLWVRAEIAASGNNTLVVI